MWISSHDSIIFRLELVVLDLVLALFADANIL